MHEVTVLDDLSTGYRENLDGLSVRWIQGSVTDVRRVDEALEGVDAIVHLAALASVPRSLLDAIGTHEANATGTLILLERARIANARHFIFSSSSAVYGSKPTLPTAERECVSPKSPYAVSKLAAEQYVLAYQKSMGMSTLALRFFNVYGPGQRAGHAYAAVVPVLLDHLLRGAPLPVNGDGTNSRDFTYVDTVCDVLMDAVEREVRHPDPVNLAFGTNTSLTELVKIIAECSGITPDVEYRDPRPGDVRHSQADNSLLRALFPGITPVCLPDGIDLTLHWMREQL